MSQRQLPKGTLPLDAQLRLQAASKVGKPGSIARRSAIDKAYRYIDDMYPEYLKQEEE
jgi:hypothetical protein